MVSVKTESDNIAGNTGVRVIILQVNSMAKGTRCQNCLRLCATSCKVAGSIPDGVIRIFH